jgi:hypothetical protein
MGIELLVGSAMALLYPAAKKAAGKLAEGLIENLSDDVYDSAGKFLGWLKGRWSNSPKELRSLEDLEADPDDTIARDTLKARLTRVAGADPEFRRELESQVKAHGPAVNVLIAIKQMEDVTGLKVKSFESGTADIRIGGETGKNIVGAEIDKLG